MNSLYGTTGTETETYLKNAHRWLNENNIILKISPYEPYVLKLTPNASGVGLYYTYEGSNQYNVIYYFNYRDFVFGGYVNGNWKYELIMQ